MIRKILSSYYTMSILLIILAIGAGIGTFLENDYGNAYAKSIIYASWWYQTLLLLSSVNLILIFLKKGKNLLRPGPIFHFSFIIILIGAFITYNFGLDGSMHIREGEKSNIFTVGEEEIKLPFYIELKYFTLKKYPGSRAPSEFNSDVSVRDKQNNILYHATIYMNNTLIHNGYKFFQTSYDDDEKGTILTVNKDPGVLVTYIGYGLLFIGLILTLFDPKSRIRFLMNKIKKMPIASILFFISLFFLQPDVIAQNRISQNYIDAYLKEHKENSQELANAFSTLIVQGPSGRMKPLDTQNREILNKLTGKSTWNGMDANQVLLGMFTRPNIWKEVNLIKVKTPKLRNLLGVPEDQKLVPFNVFFTNEGEFKLTKETERANKLVPSRRGTFERDLINVDELLNISFMTYRGTLFKIFPKPKDENNKWVDFATLFKDINNLDLHQNTYSFLDFTYNRNYNDAIINIEYIRKFQIEKGKEVVPSQDLLKAELWYNDSYIFIRLSIAYLLFGLALIFYSLISMFYNKMLNAKIQKIIYSVIIVLFIIHTFGIALRWYIGGYAPLSNTYETMIYIAYSALLAGVLFLKNSVIALGASLIMAGVFVFSAYLGEINPQITSLVPVLQSYWLSIHVSVITASYGFFGISAILGFLTLLIFIVRSPTKLHLDKHIQNITYINEATIIFGIILLTIGNFLGGIWANESWGRYWGWDPKETWTYISIIVYTLVLHFRFMKNIYSHYLFTASSVISFFSILMTYFGVNFYLSGMHSYATGDPVPLPNWAFILTGIILATIILAFNNRTIKKTNKT